MKKLTDTFKRLRAVMKDVNGDHRQIIKTMQDQIDYLMEFIDIQREILEETIGHRQPELSEDQKKRLAHRGRKLNQFLLGQVAQCFAPKTIHKEDKNICHRRNNRHGRWLQNTIIRHHRFEYWLTCLFVNFDYFLFFRL